jgi:hypothetical protein
LKIQKNPKIDFPYCAGLIEHLSNCLLLDKKKHFLTFPVVVGKKLRDYIIE